MKMEALNYMTAALGLNQTAKIVAICYQAQMLVADDTYASSVWNMVSESEKLPRMSGIETFKVENGRLTECWNPPYGYALWDGEE